MNYLHAPWMYRTWMRKDSQALQKTTQSRPLPSYSSSIDWRAGSRRTTSHLLKTNVIPAPRTQALSWTHQFLRRYFWEQFSALPVNDIIDFKLKGWHVYNNNNNSVLMWKHCIRNYELHSVATARNKNKIFANYKVQLSACLSLYSLYLIITSIMWSRFPKLWSISVLVFKPQQGSQDTIGEDGFFDLLSRFQGNRLDDQRCSLQDSPSHLPTHSSPSSTPPVAERKCELAPLCSHLCSHHIQVFWWIIQGVNTCWNTDICTKCR